MNQATFLLLFVVIGIHGAPGFPQSPYYVPSFNESLSARIYTQVMEHDNIFPELEETSLLAVYFYKAAMIENSRTDSNACWHCSSPCRGTICCSGSYPQCCMVNRVCGCCRR